MVKPEIETIDAFFDNSIDRAIIEIARTEAKLSEFASGENVNYERLGEDFHSTLNVDTALEIVAGSITGRQGLKDALTALI